MPLLQDEAAKPRPFSNCLKPESIGPVAVPGALAVQFAEPPPNLLAGGGDSELITFVLIDDKLAEPVDQPLVKEPRRTARTSTCSRMIRNLV